MPRPLFFLKKPQVKENGHESLTFYIQNVKPKEIVENVNTKIKASISKNNGSFEYIFDSRFNALNLLKSKILENAKANVISRIVESQQAQPDINFAEALARNALSQVFDEADADYFSKIIAYDTIGYGPISILLENKVNIEEIEVNGPISPISIVHSKYGRCRTNIRFTSQPGFRRTINKFIYDTEKELNEDTPIIDAQVDDSRLHAQIWPYATNGATATIRINGNNRVSLLSLINEGSVSIETMAYLWLAVDSGASVIISGAPASGKTTMLAALIPFIENYKRIVTIEEDVNELKFYSNVVNVVQLNGFKSKFFKNTREQAINALRMRPDVLIIGEVRGEETTELFAGANLGVQFMTTMHSNETGIAILNRLLSKPMQVDPNLLSMLDLSVYLEKKSETSKAISQITEYMWLSRAESEGDGIRLSNGDSVSMRYVVNNSNFDENVLRGSKILKMYGNKHGVSGEEALKELQKRKNFLKSLLKKRYNVLELVETIHNY